MSDEESVSGLVDVPRSEVALLLECGMLYLEMNKLEEAEEVFTGVAALVPHSEVPLICLGNLFFGQGRYDRALRFHRQALQKNPESSLAQAHIGEALVFANKRVEGKKALEKATEMGGDGAAFAEALLDALAAEVV
jgi:predicted Zn-dependent protease